MSLHRFALAALGVVAVAAAGCGSSGGSTKSIPAAAANPFPPVPTALMGTYVRNVTPAEVRRTAHFRQEDRGRKPPPPGRVVISFSQGKVQGLMKVRDTGGPFAFMDFSARPTGELRFTSYTDPGKVGAFCGPDIPTQAQYEWKVNGDVLVLKPTEDRCADRDTVLTGSWKRR